MSSSSTSVDVKPDYHGHPNYFSTWLVLVTILIVSLALGYLGHSTAAVVAIFGLAAIKALFVGANFMHLRWEPKLLTAFIVWGVLCLLFLFFGVLPDIVLVKAQLAH